MDEWLLKLMLEAIQGFCVACGIMIMETIINQWMLILIAILVILFFFATKFYMKIAQDLKRLEGISKYIITASNTLLDENAAYITFLMSKFVDSCQRIHILKLFIFLHYSLHKQIF